jgi:hypothetical protein
MFTPSSFTEGLGLRLAKVELVAHDLEDEEEEHILPTVDETTPLILPTDEDWLLGGEDGEEVSCYQFFDCMLKNASELLLAARCVYLCVKSTRMLSERLACRAIIAV